MHVDLIFDDGLLRESLDLSKGEGGEFAELFELGLRAIERLAEHCPPRSVRIGRLGAPSARGFQEFFAGLEREKPIEVRAPFEDSDAIAGGAWLGSEHFPNRPGCALAKLCFSAGAVDLP
ncbi:MAG: hypothetical protein KDD69_16285, partial [Bdellovibrionales bacterium]|nr:hypothetical protein [Bdellovibrionales bacterium]